MNKQKPSTHSQALDTQRASNVGRFVVPGMGSLPPYLRT